MISLKHEHDVTANWEAPHVCEYVFVCVFEFMITGNSPCMKHSSRDQRTREHRCMCVNKYFHATLFFIVIIPGAGGLIVVRNLH